MTNEFGFRATAKLLLVLSESVKDSTESTRLCIVCENGKKKLCWLVAAGERSPPRNIVVLWFLCDGVASAVFGK